MSDLVRLSLSIEKPLFEKLEALVAESDYTNRSEFVRDLVRARLVEQQWSGQADALGVVLLLYDHHARGLSGRLTRLQHDFAGEVLATTHLHLDHHHCAEMIMVRGLPADIRRFVDRMHREKGVLHADLAVGSSGEELA